MPARNLVLLAAATLLVGAAPKPAPTPAPKPAQAATPAAADAVALVTVTGVKAKGGTLRVGLYDAATFLRAAPIVQAEAKVTAAGAMTVRIGGVKPGDYAVTALHDANDNRRMDMDSGRMSEGTALSNAEKLRGMPTFDVTKLTLAPGVTNVTIAMSYPEDRTGW